MRLGMQKKVESKTALEAQKEFIACKRNENLSDESIKTYIQITKIFLKFYGENMPCAAIDFEVVESYKAYLRTKPRKKNNPAAKDSFLSDKSVEAYIRHLRVFVYYCIVRGYTPDFKIKLPRTEKEPKEEYTAEELRRILKKPNIKTCAFSEYRNWVISNFLLATANRLSTIANIKIKHLNFEDEEIVLHKVKNRKAYIIPMHGQLKKILLEYLSFRGGAPDDYLFCSETDDLKPLAKNSIKSAIARYNRKRGVTKTSVHLYRNTMAKYWIINGGDPFRLQAMLGHKTLDMVKEYLNMYSDDLKKDFDKVNPLTQFATGERIRMK